MKDGANDASLWRSNITVIPKNEGGSHTGVQVHKDV